MTFGLAPPSAQKTPTGRPHIACEEVMMKCADARTRQGFPHEFSSSAPRSEDERPNVVTSLAPRRA